MKRNLFFAGSLLISLLSAAQPYLFGTTEKGGINNNGVLFAYDVAAHTYVNIVDFYGGNGTQPTGKLVWGNDQKIYGATARGGTAIYGRGVIYSWDPSHRVFTRIYSILGAPIPGQLIYASPTEFFANSDTAIYKFNTATMAFDRLYSFDPGVTSERFLGTLTLASNGILYGIRSAGLNNYIGELISFNPVTNTYRVIYKFDQGPAVGTANGTFPTGDLQQGADGLLYGTASDGGNAPGHGAIFSFNPANDTYVLRYSFLAYGPLGGRPGTLQKGIDGKFYGFTTEGGQYNRGTAFCYSPADQSVTKLTDIKDDFYGGSFIQGMLIASDGNFYATTSNEGANQAGTLYTYMPGSLTYQTLLDFDSNKGTYPIPNSLLEVPARYSLTCPQSRTLIAGDQCRTVVTDIDPIVFPSGTQVQYTLLNASTGGDTISKGYGSASGLAFNRFQTEVLYTITNHPEVSCSFQVNVMDTTPPVLSVPDSIFHCFDDMTAPGSGKYTVPAAHATDNCTPVVAYRYVVKNSRGTILRSGTTPDASGRFEEGRNTVEWTVSQLEGSLTPGLTTYDTTVVMINPKLSANLTLVRPLSEGTSVNTLYLGYAPASTARLEVTARSGSGAYAFKWTVTGNTLTYTQDARNPAFLYVTARQPGTATFTATVTDSRGCKTQVFRTLTVEDVRCGSFSDKVTVCRRLGNLSYQSQCIPQNEVAALLHAGSQLGSCPVSGTPVARIQESARKWQGEGLVLQAFPNPSISGFRLTITSNRSDVIRLQVTDATGRLIEEREGVIPGSTQIIGTHYPAGIYVCEALQNGVRKQLKIVKQ
ncbi:MAG TPA: choice-of-anchor tandem repeat GloVer-containing protein [Flavisolibacter sp.]|jgi:uncharacterized repeat protein (TIGR03803 family)|nr:choice-of-anchor tandem repeat GloVer-containing protein [Flavisolibacter sp.]